MQHTENPLPPRVNSARALARLSDKLNGISNDYDVMREAVDGLLPILDARAGLAMVQSPSAMTYAKHHSHSQSLTMFEQTVRERGEKVLSLFSLEEHRRIHDADGMTLIPLRWQKKTIGLLAFDLDVRRIAPQDEMGVFSLCNQLAAIFGARQMPMQSHSINGAQNAMEQAVELQQRLQPTVPSLSCGLSIATHTQAAEFVGGDYFDLILVDQNKMGIVIADVEGKGVSAALFGNLLRTTVHFLTRESPSTASVVGKINTILHKEASTTQKIFTLFYAVFDPVSKWLTYTGSGHVNPIVVRSEDGTVERLVSEGMPIGIEPRQRFTERSVQLNTGDVISFFTDGLVDCIGSARETFGEHRLMNTLQANNREPVDAILKTVLTELSEFAPTPSDDLTMILAKVV